MNVALGGSFRATLTLDGNATRRTTPGTKTIRVELPVKNFAEFAEWAKSPLARTGMVAGAKALALTALDLLARPDELKRAKEEFERGVGG